MEQQSLMTIPSNPLAAMLKLQKELLVHYITIEGLPEYPIDINSRSGQKLIKDFANRMSTELSESFEQLCLANEAASNNRPQEARGFIAGYNEEIADMMHFFLEFLIYCGIDEYILTDLIKNYGSDKGWGNLIRPDNPLGTLLSLGSLSNSLDNFKPINKRTDLFIVVDDMESLDNPLIRGARRMGPNAIAEHSTLLWVIVYNLDMTTNNLKNKDWSQTEQKVNEVQFYTRLTITILALGQYLDYAGFNQTSLYCSYMRKNSINLQRIKNKY